ncbi:abortive infection system antitoxin AbiGi family protein [Xanthomonas euroxanthea]|uniref:abortive infection system antitoxin AbiGi family protein n=1 Tax=Xanthomonas euroxanthea TaxID=2259622 RepID=UPI003CCD9FB1
MHRRRFFILPTSKHCAESSNRISASHTRASESYIEGGQIEFAAPMVSFCDLRLSELRSHMTNYGCYGLGMKKEWAARNGVNPVYYISSQASFPGDYIAAVWEIWRLREHLHPRASDSPFIQENQEVAAPALPDQV